MHKQHLVYWYALAMMQGLSLRRRNAIYVACYRHEPRFSIVDLFESREVRAALGLSAHEEHLFAAAKADWAYSTWAVDNLLAQGCALIPLHSDAYPRLLKKHLGLSSPAALFVKGNAALLQDRAIAVVGSRQAAPISLHFVDNIVYQAVSRRQTVVSGFARGVDREALNAAAAAGGSSIIVLPQGILTFAYGFRDYSRYLARGQLLVISQFAPQQNWSVPAAMDRNAVIYGLAEEIYVAQSAFHGGTWSGAVDGLKRGRRIMVRCPEPGERSANQLLIDQGAVPVDLWGREVKAEKRLNPHTDDLFTGQANS